MIANKPQLTLNYDSLKNYGKFVRRTALHISSYLDIYKAALDLPDAMLAYFPLSRLAFAEVCLAIQEDQLTVSKVIDKYIMSPQIDQYIINNPCFDEKMKFDFIEHDCGEFYDLIQMITYDIDTLKVLAHPLEYKEERVYQATHAIAERVEPTPENEEATKYCIETLKHKKQPSEQPSEQRSEQPSEQASERVSEQVSEQASEQPTSQPEVHIDNEQPKYIISNDRLLHDILKYLHSTGVLDETVTVQKFFTAVENADISGIHPIVKEKFWSSLSPTKVCIKTKRAEWLRDICASINIVPKTASRNNTNNNDRYDWWDNFKELVAKGSKK